MKLLILLLAIGLAVASKGASKEKQTKITSLKTTKITSPKTTKVTTPRVVTQWLQGKRSNEDMRDDIILPENRMPPKDRQFNWTKI